MNDPTRLSVGTGPWRLLLLVDDDDDPKWVIATVTLESDVMPAQINADGTYRNWAAVTHWARLQMGLLDLELRPLVVQGWRAERPGDRT